MIEEKHRRIKYTIGITAAVYLSFRYILPLVIPFLVALLLALIIFPITRFIQKKLHIRENISTILVLIIGITAFFGLTMFAGLQLWKQLQRFLETLPAIFTFIYQWIDYLGNFFEQILGMDITLPVETMLEEQGSRIQKVVFDYSLQSVVSLIKRGTGLFAASFVTLLSCFVMVRDRKMWRRRFRKSSFYMEGKLLLDKLYNAGENWLHAQFIIMAIVTSICVLGLWISGASCPFLGGIVTGIFDALPLFGTGTILIPWIILLLLQTKWMMALKLAILYLITYVTREVLEERMLGDSMGMSSLEFLISVYVGWKLFGIGGFVLGPLGLLIIRMGLLLMM
jgi:sporulation integral membrane protein YtvI